ncbi:PAS domain S-box protein [Pyxidicoccus sp. 3LFB2]
MTRRNAAAHSDSLPRPEAPLHILLLEDSPQDAELLEATLEEAGLIFELTRTASHEGFNAALVGCRFDIILSDYNIPGFDGVAALSAAHLACPDVPFLFVSGALGEDKAIELLKRGATDYVLKDRLERLVPSVQRALREAHERHERQRAEEGRRKSEERLRLALESARLGIWDVDLRTGTCELDATAAAALGVTPGTVLTLERSLRAVHPDDFLRVRGAIDTALDVAVGGHYQLEYRHIGGEDGVERWVSANGQAFFDAQGQPLRFVGTVRDITEAKRAEQERAQMATVVEESTDFVGIAHLDGRAFFVNRAGQQLVGLDGPEAVRQTRFMDYFMPESVPEAERILKLALDTGHCGGELRFRHFKTGESIPVWWNLFPIKSPQTGRTVAMATVTRDLRAQKQHEAEIQRRVDFEQQLIGIVSHDLRNPLNAITLSASMLVRQEGLDERSTKGVRRILTSAERATRMIRDLLDFTQARLAGGIPIEVKPVDLHELVSQVIDELEHAHPERALKLTQEGDTQGAWDPDRMAQVVTNLTTNALKYSPEGSLVTVRTRGEANAVVLEVHNRGEPIAPERLPHLFKPLSRGVAKVDVQTRSIGLGLFIVDSIVRAHGGSVTVRSTGDEGTTLTVRLPRDSVPVKKEATG